MQFLCSVDMKLVRWRRKMILRGHNNDDKGGEESGRNR
jgi:hypothetical protein